MGVKVARYLPTIKVRSVFLGLAVAVTTDPVGNVQAIEKLIPKNGQVQQAVQMHAIKQSMEASEASLLHLIQSVRPGVGQNVNVKA